MNATINGMDYIYADTLSLDQLLPGDFVEVNDYNENIIVKLKTIEERENDWLLTCWDEFGDSCEFVIESDKKIKLYVFK